MVGCVFAIVYSAVRGYGQFVFCFFFEEEKAALAFFGVFAIGFFYFPEEGRVRQYFQQ